MQNEKLNAILTASLEEISKASTSEEIIAIRNKYLAKKSELMSIMSTIGSLSIEEKKTIGQ